MRASRAGPFPATDAATDPMNSMTRRVSRLGLALAATLLACAAHALTPEQVLAMAVGDSDERAAAIAQAAASGDAKAPAFSRPCWTTPSRWPASGC